MKKITELTKKVRRPVHDKRLVGQRSRFYEEIEVPRPVQNAKWWKRVINLYVDFFVVAMLINLLIAATGVYSDQTGVTNTFVGVIGMLIIPTYGYLFEKFKQKTIAKYLTKTIVVDEYGNTPSNNQLLIRSLVKCSGFISLFPLLKDNGRCLHDILSKTYVLNQKEFELIKTKLDAEKD